MSEKETGGAAFPQISSDLVGSHGDYHTEISSAGGMTLRDYFAAKAMQGFCAGAEAGDELDMLPELAYMMADAMIKAREA